MPREFSDRRGFASTLETDKENDAAAAAAELVGGCRAGGEEGGEFVDDGALDEFGNVLVGVVVGSSRIRSFAQEALDFGLDGTAQASDELDVHIGFNQSASNVSE